MWVKPEIVFELKAADLTLSGIHTAALDKIEPGHGISLRFPKCVVEVEDCKPEDCSSTLQILEIYNQNIKKKVTYNFDESL